MMLLPADVIVQEVAPRDGFQIEPRFVPTADKIALIDALSATGLTKIEASSFVSPAAVPMLADAAAVFAGIRRSPGVTYTALAPNLRGARAALTAGVDEVNLVLSVSNTHNLANMRMTTDRSLEEFGAIAREIGSIVPINGTVATAFGCPFEGPQPVARVLALVEAYLALGFRGVTLADTTGMADPVQVEGLVAELLRQFPGCALTLHFHNTRGLGLANVLAALQAGATRFDASLGGLGGCPYAPGASGNICTEDLVHMLQAMGLRTGIDLESLLDLSRGLPALLGHDVPGQVAKSGARSRRYPVPGSFAQSAQSRGRIAAQ
jgi:hydroxymethylglutaryl-CoA lyase